MKTTATTPEPLDVVIVGGGMVGGVLAWALAGCGLQVGLVERGLLADAPAAAGQRSTALSWGSRVLLEAVGLWQNLAADAEPIKTIHVSQQGHLGTVRLKAEQHQIDALGYVVRNASVSTALAEKLPSMTNLTLYAPTHVHTMEQHDYGVELGLASGQVLNSKLVIVADGSDSATRELAQLDVTTEDYEQHAIVATLTSRGAPAHKAWERFTPQGPLALLPLGENQLSLVYTVPSDHLTDTMSLDDDAFIAQVQSCIGQRPGRILSTSPRQCFALRRIAVGSSWQGRVALLGNAARTLHPVAGQGFNLALRDAMTLAELLQNLALGQDSGADFVREQYLSKRAADQRETLTLTDSLARLFKGQSSILGHLRGAGLLATDRLPTLRQNFARRSMGLAHRTPKVATPNP